MAIRFDRRLRAEIDLRDGSTLVVTEPRMSFDLARSATDVLPDGTVTLHDVARRTSDKVQAGAVAIRFLGGYGDTLGLLHEGSVRRVTHRRDGLERLTVIAVGGRLVIPPGETPQTRDVTLSYAEAVDGLTIIREVASQLGLGIGDTGLVPDVSYPSYYWHGDGTAVLTNILRGHDVEWYEENGMLRFSALRQASVSAAETIPVNGRTGMVGSPETEYDDDGGLSVAVRMLLNPAVHLGVNLQVESELVTGVFKVVELVHRGDNWLDDEYVTIAEGVPLP